MIVKGGFVHVAFALIKRITIDFVRTEMGKIIVRGWAADMDVPNEPIDVHIYAICDGVREGIGILNCLLYTSPSPRDS